MSQTEDGKQVKRSSVMYARVGALQVSGGLF